MQPPPRCSRAKPPWSPLPTCKHSLPGGRQRPASENTRLQPVLIQPPAPARGTCSCLLELRWEGQNPWVPCHHRPGMCPSRPIDSERQLGHEDPTWGPADPHEPSPPGTHGARPTLPGCLHTHQGHRAKRARVQQAPRGALTGSSTYARLWFTDRLKLCGGGPPRDGRAGSLPAAAVPETHGDGHCRA